MVRKLLLASALSTATAIAVGTPAYAGGWTFAGPHGGTATFNHWGGFYGGYHPGSCCYGGRVAAGAAAGLTVGAAVGVAAASHPAYVVAPPAVVYAPPPVVYAPRGYYYTP